MPIPRLLALLLLAAVACGEDFTPTLAHPWRPSPPPDPDCPACQTIGRIDDAHLGPIEVLVDPEAADPVAQFGECARTILACWIGDAALADCVAASACPAPCRTEFARQAAAGDAFDALDAVFLADGAPCGEPAEVAP